MPAVRKSSTPKRGVVLPETTEGWTAPDFFRTNHLLLEAINEQRQHVPKCVLCHDQPADMDGPQLYIKAIIEGPGYKGRKQRPVNIGKICVRCRTTILDAERARLGPTTE